MGSQNSIKSRIIDNNASVFIGAGRCELAYESVTNFDVEDHPVDLYYFFKNNTQQKDILLEYMKFMCQEWGNMSRFVKI